MEEQDTIKLIHNVRVELFKLKRDSQGRYTGGRYLAEVREVHNLVVTTGKTHIADQLASAPAQGAMSHMAIGTGATAAAAGDTTLQTELDRNALTTRTAAAGVVTYVGNWAAGDGTGAITEEGILNAASVGTLLARSVFSVINKGASDTLAITHTVTVG